MASEPDPLRAPVRPVPYYPEPASSEGSSAATASLVLGILGIVVCGLCGPFAWSMGNRVVAEIDRSGGAYGGRTEANVGRILGIVSTALLILSVVLVVGVFAVGGIFTSTSG